MSVITKNITKGRLENAIPLVFGPFLPDDYLSAMGKTEQQADADRLRAIWNRRKTEWKLTQEVFAERVGMGQAFFNHLLHGRKPLNYEHLTTLAAALKTRPEDISPSLAAKLKALSASLPIVAEPAAEYQVDRGRQLRDLIGDATQADRVALLRALFDELVEPGGNVRSRKRRGKVERRGR